MTPDVLEDDSPTDTASLRISHPQRIQAFMPEVVDVAAKFLGREWPKWEAGLRDTSRVLPDLFHEFVTLKQWPKSTELADLSQSTPDASDQGGSLGMLAYIRHRLNQSPHFLLTDELVALLEHTDISDDIPVSMLTVPFPNQFLEFGSTRTCGVSVPHAASGLHVLEGVYIERGRHTVEGEMLQVLLIGSPLGKSNTNDDATLSIALRLSDPSAQLADALQDAFNHAKAAAHHWGHRMAPDYFIEHSLEALKLVCKALLYIGLPGTRRELQLTRTNLLTQREGLKSPAKRGKLDRRLAKALDYVVIKPQPEHGNASSELGNDVRRGGVKAHWRRGHYRLQPVGPQLVDRRLVYLQPTLVSASMANDPVMPENYLVR